MKILFFLTAVLFLNVSFGQTKIKSKKHGVLEFVELDHGIAKVAGGKSEPLKNSPNGHVWLEDFEIIKVTDSVPVELKTNFGVVYGIKAKDSVDINVDIEWIFPEKITNEKGETFKSFRYTTKRPTNTPSASSYSLDAPYEMVKGDWKVNIYIEDKLMYSRTFILY